MDELPPQVFTNPKKFFKKYGIKLGFILILLFLFFNLPGAINEWHDFGNLFTQKKSVEGIKDSISSDNITNPKEFDKDLESPVVASTNEYELWDFSRYNSDESGLYCTKDRQRYQYPQVWYKENVPLLFSKVRLKYKIFNKYEDENVAKSFVIFIGKDIKISEFYIPQSNPQQVGFKTFSYKGDIAVPSPAVEVNDRTLQDPIENGSSIEIQVSTDLQPNGKILFSYGVTYLSAKTGIRLPDTFSFEVDVSDTSPENTLTQIGIGILKGNCIHPQSFTINE